MASEGNSLLLNTENSEQSACAYKYITFQAISFLLISVHKIGNSEKQTTLPRYIWHDGCGSHAHRDLVLTEAVKLF